eukprot:Rmarinus@m.26050
MTSDPLETVLLYERHHLVLIRAGPPEVVEGKANESHTADRTNHNPRYGTTAQATVTTGGILRSKGHINFSRAHSVASIRQVGPQSLRILKKGHLIINGNVTFREGIRLDGHEVSRATRSVVPLHVLDLYAG